MFDSKHQFTMDNYARQRPFSSFLPGIAGKTGIPLWCFYVNRGQGVSCFGVSGKSDAILPFQPANRAYRNTGLGAFRTFLRIGGKEYYEPFQDKGHAHRLTVGMNVLYLLERNEEAHLRVSVRYCVLPEEPVAALMRQVEIRNCGFETIDLEAADGLPQIFPYGLLKTGAGQAGQKAQSRTQTRHPAEDLPFFQMQNRTGQAAADEGRGHFAFSFDKSGQSLADVFDVEALFGYDTSLLAPRPFLESGVAGVLAYKQSGISAYPSCFFLQEARLAPGETMVFNSLYGHASREEDAIRCQMRFRAPGLADQKFARAAELTEELCRPIETKSADPVFDAYCAQSFLDNLLRGGVPETIGGPHNPKIFHIYRRMNGDLERDYNDFYLEPEYYSQGEVHYNDVIQNRRCDVRYYPEVMANNLRSLADLIQPDGYQPLIVESSSLLLDESLFAHVLRHVAEEDRERARRFMRKRFTPGRFLMEAESWVLQEGMTAAELLNTAAEFAERKAEASYGEGYWTGYWCDLLDLLLRFEEIYPDLTETELFDAPVYLYYAQKAVVKPRSKRYVLTGEGVRQQGLPEVLPSFRNQRKWVRSRYGNGERLEVTLAEKLILLAVIKFATLDAWGFGIEMEAGHPSWPNSLNGLPELFGSAAGDSCVLLRLLAYLLKKLENTKRDVEVAGELAGLFTIVAALAKKHRSLFFAGDDILPFWQEVNEAREAFRSRVLHGFSGNRVRLTCEQLCNAFHLWQDLILERKNLLMMLSGGIFPAYMYYEMTEYSVTETGIIPERFEPRFLPPFLEGAICHFDFCRDTTERRCLHQMVMNSVLYDERLDMLRCCALTGDAPRSLGDILSYNPGWYANQAVRLQLAYKYLRRLLEGELYDEFADCLRRFATPFMDAELYGRSPLENVSFLVSSLSADKNAVGRGMEGRYTSANAEFLLIWQQMMIGPQPFTLADEGLRFALRPTIPDYLIPPRRYVNATLLGRIPLLYFIAEDCAVVPGRYRVVRYKLYYGERCEEIAGDFVPEAQAKSIRACEPDRINVYLESV